MPHSGLILTLIGYTGRLYAVHHFRNSGLGLVFVFALTGFMRVTLGPVISAYPALANGTPLVAMTVVMTGLIFMGLSRYVLVTRQNFGFLGGLLLAGMLVALLAILFEISARSLAVSSAFAVLMAGLILYETSNIIHGGETNYIMATVILYVAVFNLFTNLLNVLGFTKAEE